MFEQQIKTYGVDLLFFLNLMWVGPVLDRQPWFVRSLGARTIGCRNCQVDEDALAQEELVTLYRPVGPKELELIRESGNRAFPPRLPEQPIFYPVLNEEYASKIARDWNAPSKGVGYVTRFQVRADFLQNYDVQTVGRRVHQEYWIPAEDLEDFNRNIVGPIEVVAEYRATTS